MRDSGLVKGGGKVPLASVPRCCLGRGLKQSLAPHCLGETGFRVCRHPGDRSWRGGVLEGEGMKQERERRGGAGSAGAHTLQRAPHVRTRPGRGQRPQAATGDTGLCVQKLRLERRWKLFLLDLGLLWTHPSGTYDKPQNRQIQPYARAKPNDV